MTDTTTPLPPVVDRDTWTAQVNELRVRETAHTREGDAIAATRRRLPMVEVDASTPLRRWQTLVRENELAVPNRVRNPLHSALGARSGRSREGRVGPLTCHL
jgi:Bacterial protein of unknown function (DUF899)